MVHLQRDYRIYVDECNYFMIHYITLEFCNNPKLAPVLLRIICATVNDLSVNCTRYRHFWAFWSPTSAEIWHFRGNLVEFRVQKGDFLVVISVPIRLSTDNY